MSMPRQEQERVYQHGLGLFNAGDFRAAAELLRKLIEYRKRDPEFWRVLGASEMQHGYVDRGREYLYKALKFAPSRGEIYREIAMSHRIQGDFDDALQAINKGLNLRSKSPELLSYKADLIRLQGNPSESIDLLDPIIADTRKKLDPLIGMSYAHAALVDDRYEDSVSMTDRLLEEDGLTEFFRMQILFLRARALDKAARHTDAMECVLEANSLRRVTFDPEAWSAAVDTMLTNWSAEQLAEMSKSNCTTDAPIFIVGMPRSGTTLIEQILSNHPDIKPLGERPEINRLSLWFQHNINPEAPLLTHTDNITKEHLDRSSAEYLKRTGAVESGSSRFTDKLPTNFLSLGLISLLFPNARIVHCQRDPLDVGVSCLFQNFVGALRWAYNPAHIAPYYRDYQRIMDHWKNTISIPMLDIRYEEVVEDIEKQARKLIEFVGLEWNDACLRFHESDRLANTSSIDQVRRPLYNTSVRRWERYGESIAPLRNAMETAGVLVGNP